MVNWPPVGSAGRPDRVSTEDSSLHALFGELKGKKSLRTNVLYTLVLSCLCMTVIKDNGLKDRIIKLKREVIICYTISP